MSARRGIFAALGSGFVALGACNFSLDGYAGDPLVPDSATEDSPAPVTDAGPGAIDATDAADADAGASCPGNAGPTMVRVVGNGGTTSFCIDSTHVTNAQYVAFLATGAAPSADNQPPSCLTFNTTFRPGTGANVDDPTKQNFPVTVVDWCDAYAYCRFAGKRLCGKIGGGRSSSAEYGSTTNEMYFACSRGGAQAYNYANTFDASACNTSGKAVLEPVANRPTCVGGYPGLYDIVGNVGSWQDNCESEDGGMDRCVDNSTSWEYVGGGGDPAFSAQCAHYDEQHRIDAFNDLGFRCCAD